MITVSAPANHCGSAWLITPASASPGRLDTARTAGADVAVLDLEDSVAHHRKDAARATAIGYLTQATGAGATVLGLRLNAPGTVHAAKDLVAVAESGLRPAVVVVPKVESARDVELVAAVLGADQEQRRVWALIETPRAIQSLPEILVPRCLAGVVFGAADYAAAAGCSRSSSALRYPRSALACAAAAAGLPAIDSPYFDLDDPDGLRREAEEAKDLGFVGKGAVRPTQLSLIRQAFLPSAQELAAAHAVVTAATAANGAITTVNGAMVGPPIVAAAHAVTAHAAGVTGSDVPAGSS